MIAPIHSPCLTFWPESDTCLASAPCCAASGGDHCVSSAPPPARFATLVDACLSSWWTCTVDVDVQMVVKVTIVQMDYMDDNNDGNDLIYGHYIERTCGEYDHE